MANVKVFADKQRDIRTDLQTERPKTIFPRYLQRFFFQPYSDLIFLDVGGVLLLLLLFTYKINTGKNNQKTC